MLILDWMKSNVISVPPDASLLQCRKLFKDNHIGRLPVVDADKIVVGLISASDITRRIFAVSASLPTGTKMVADSSKTGCRT